MDSVVCCKHNMLLYKIQLLLLRKRKQSELNPLNCGCCCCCCSCRSFLRLAIVCASRARSGGPIERMREMFSPTNSTAHSSLNLPPNHAALATVPPIVSTRRNTHFCCRRHAHSLNSLRLTCCFSQSYQPYYHHQSIDCCAKTLFIENKKTNL